MLREVAAEYHDEAVSDLGSYLVELGCEYSPCCRGILVPASLVPATWPTVLMQVAYYASV